MTPADESSQSPALAERFSLDPPIEPMLAKPIPGLPLAADGLSFEPKWDGFRVLIYRRGNDVVIQGRMRAADAAATGSWDLSYAFPEMIDAIRALRAGDVVLDGELVVIRSNRLAFDALQGRLRPRKEAGGWKIAELAADFPTSFVAFDLLAHAGRDLREAPAAQRRAELAEVLAGEGPPIHLTPQTRDLEVAARWLAELPGAGLDGLIARRQDGRYTPGRRTLSKIKQVHTVDVVCAGWREYARPGPDGQPVVGSVLLGLYDEVGVLQMVGAMGSFPMAERARLAAQFAKVPAAPEHPWLDPQGRAPGGPSRWSGGRARPWTPLPLDLVAEVSYNQAESGQIRHLASFVRWRPDKSPDDCTIDQLVTPAPVDIASVLAASS
ncbi:MAG: ATP-dependent DNA ligase [Candidatus Nanopelagicales bacterium]